MLRPTLSALSLLLCIAAAGCSQSDPGAALAQSTGTDAVDGTDGDEGTDGADRTDGTGGTDGTTGGDGTGGPQCGNGVCNDGERPASCPEDCSDCLAGRCGEHLAACEGTPGCLDLYQCIEACTAPDCPQQCIEAASPDALPAMQRLRQCVQMHGCTGGPTPDACGDGACSPSETPATCPQDCPTGPACGDGQCQPGEGPEACPQDCPTGPACGDGQCQPSEGPEMCPQDCGGLEQCLLDQCPQQTMACFNSPGCSQLLQCLQECSSEQCGQQCLAQAGPDAAQQLQALRMCGQQSGCLDEGPLCGNGQCQPGEHPGNCPEDCESVPGCGDGQCDDSESPQSCPQDCEPDITGCLAEQCPGPTQQCFSSPGCVSLVTCLQDCGPSEQCGQGCFQQAGPGALAQLEALVACGEAEGCLGGGGCGDGVCAPNESPQSCPQDCGGGSCVGQCSALGDDAPCQCDPECLQFDDCCPDYEEVCLDDPQCGDGQCDEGEMCPEDCQAVDPAICIYDQCNEQVTACTTDFQCTQGLQCLAACNGPECAFQCADEVQSDLLTPVATCAVAKSCYP